MIEALGIAAATAVVALATNRLARPPSRLFASTNPSSTPSRASGLTRVGSLVRRRFNRPPDPTADVVVGRQIGAVAVITPFSPMLAIVAGATIYVVSILGKRRAARERAIEVQATLAEVVDLFATALLSGHNVTTAIHQVSRWADGDLGPALRWCSDQVAHGRRLDEVLELLPDRLDPSVRPLVSALRSHELHGAPVVDTLAQLAADLRMDRRRQAEAAARRLPVALLFPLVVCVLPAFLLLTVVPVVAQAIAALEF